METAALKRKTESVKHDGLNSGEAQHMSMGIVPEARHSAVSAPMSANAARMVRTRHALAKAMRSMMPQACPRTLPCARKIRNPAARAQSTEAFIARQDSRMRENSRSVRISMAGIEKR